MDNKLRRVLLIEEYHGYLDILDQKGIPVEPGILLPPAKLSTIDLVDLRTIVAVLRGLARTPSGT